MPAAGGRVLLRKVHADATPQLLLLSDPNHPAHTVGLGVSVPQKGNGSSMSLAPSSDRNLRWVWRRRASCRNLARCCVLVICFMQLLLPVLGYSDRGSAGESGAISMMSIDAEGSVSSGTTQHEVARYARAKRGLDLTSKDLDRGLQQRRFSASSSPSSSLSSSSSSPSLVGRAPSREESQGAQPEPDPVPLPALLQLDDPPKKDDAEARSKKVSIQSRLSSVWDSVSKRGSRSDQLKCLNNKPGYDLNPLPGGAPDDYRMEGPMLGAFDRDFAVYSDQDCKEKLENVTVAVTQFLNVTDLVDKSWLAIRLGNVSSEDFVYVCGPTVGTYELSCLAQIGPDESWHSVESMKGFLAGDEEDPGLAILEMVLILLGLLLMCSLLHALYLLMTLHDPDPRHPLQGLGTTSTLMMLANTTIKGAMFVLGVDHMATKVMEACLADVPPWVVDGVFCSGVLLSVLGVLRLSELLYATQICEVGMRQGKCVLPNSTVYFGLILGQPLALAVLDILVIAGMVVFAGFNIVGIYWLYGDFNGPTMVYQDIFQKAVACWQSFPSLLSALASNLAKHTLQHRGMCIASMRVLSPDFKTEGPDCSLMTHLGDHPKVEVSMGQICNICREGNDPLNLIDFDNRDPATLPSSTGLRPQDIRWHARFIYKKTGSKATVCSLPLCIGLMLTVFVRSAYNRAFYISQMPTLEIAVPSAGHLFPEFNPHILDYNLYYPQHVSTVSLMNRGDELLAREKEFIFQGNATSDGAQENPLYRMSLDKKDFPFELHVNMRGGNATKGTAKHSTHYSFSITKVERLILTMKFTAGDWSWCGYATSLDEMHLGIPKNADRVSVEISTAYHIWGIPIPMKKWNEVARLPDNPLASKTTSVFVALENATGPLCYEACAKYRSLESFSRCIMTRRVPDGCYHIMVAWSKDSCRTFHSSNNSTKEGQELTVKDEISGFGPTLNSNTAIASLLRETKRTVALCNGRYSKCDEKEANHTAKLVGRFFESITLELPDPLVNIVTATFHARSDDQPRGTAVFSRSLHLWKGAPDVAAILVVPEKGKNLSVQKIRQADGSFLVTVQEWQFNKVMGPLRFLVFAAIEDFNFNVDFDKSVKKLDGAFDDEDDWQTSSYCDRLHEFERLRFPACSSRCYKDSAQQAAAIIELDPLFPSKTLIGEVYPRADLTGGRLSTKKFRIDFQAADLPAVWAFRQSQPGPCILNIPSRSAEDAYQMLDVPAALEVANCPKGVTLMTRDGNASFTPEQFFAWSVRNAVDPAFQIGVLDGFIEKRSDIVGETLKLDKDGLIATSKELATPNFKRRWDIDFKIPLRKIFFHSVKVDKIMCFFWKRGDRVHISPQFLVDSWRGVWNDEKRQAMLTFIRDCSDLPPIPIYSSDVLGLQRDWIISSTSPIATAIQWHEPEILDALLDKYAKNYTLVLKADGTDQTLKLDYMELTVYERCHSCVDSVLKFRKRLMERCAGEEKREKTAISPECKALFDGYRWLDLGHRNFQSDGHVLDIINITTKLSKVDFQTAEMDSSELTNARLADFLPLWHVVPNVTIFTLADNHLDLCASSPAPAEGRCTWTVEQDLILEEDFDKDTFDSFGAAFEACQKKKEAFCKQISCEAAGRCRIFFLLSSFPYSSIRAPGGAIYTLNKECHEDRLFEFLSTFEKLASLDLSSNRLCEPGILQVARALPASSALKDIVLSNTGITSKDVNGLKEVAGKFKQLEKLDASQNELGAVGLSALLGESLTLKSLKASDISLTFEDEEAFKALTKKLEACTEMEEVDLSNNNFGDAGMVMLAGALMKWKKLKHLDVHNTGITGASFGALAKALVEGEMQELLLGENDFSQHNVLGKFGALRKLEHLVKLDLHQAKLNDHSLRTFQLEGLGKLHHLKSLVLWGNRFTSDTLELCLKSVGKVTSLQLGDNEVKKKSRSNYLPEFFPDAVTKFEELGLSGYELDMGAINASWTLFLGKEEHKALDFPIQKLWLDRGLSENGHELPDFFSIFGFMKKLTLLSLNENHFSRGAMRGLLKTASELPRLKVLRISGSKFVLEDWPRVNTPCFQTLEQLEGDFTLLDIQYLRHYLPQAGIKSSLSHPKTSDDLVVVQPANTSQHQGSASTL